MLDEPLPIEKAREVELVKGPNIASIPQMDPIPDDLELEVLLKMDDNISTDEILAGGARVLPYRSNLPEISKFSFEIIDDTYYSRAVDIRDKGGHAIVGGYNYGQGSSREHAALAPRYLGLRVALVKDFARIHWQNLVNFGVLPLTFTNPDDHDKLEQGDVLQLTDLRQQIQKGRDVTVKIKGKNKEIPAQHALSERQIDIMLKGGQLNLAKEEASQ